MTKRRDKGDGSIYQRASDKKWVGYARLDQGKKKYVYGNTKAEASKKLKELQRSIEQGTLVTAKAETVEAYLQYWLSVHSAKIKETTVISYNAHINSCLQHIGTITLQKLTGRHLQKMYTELSKVKNNNSLRVTHTILKAAFKDAIRWKRLAHNPCEDIDAPTTQREQRPFLNAEQSKILLQTAQGTNIECFLSMALTTGMRRGEMLGLRWADINMEQKYLSVQRTASYIKLQGKKYEYVETTPKTKASRRSIRLTDYLITVLKQHKKRQLEIRLQTGQEWVNKDLVFCSSKGNHLSIYLIEDLFKKLLQENGFPQLHIHDLRHSCAVLLASMSVPAKVIQEILGHSSIIITQDLYGHVIAGMQDEAMQKMDTLFKKEG